MFPNVSFSGMPNSQFLTENNIQDVVEAERKDRLYYYVTQGDVVLVDGVPTQQYTNTAMAVEDVDAVDSDGNPIYVQEYDASANGGEGAMVDTSVQMITRGLKYSFKNRIKSQANSALAGTDWMVIRKAERSVEIPAATVTYRAAVITEYDRLKVAITGAADVDALAVVMGAQNWPVEAI
jgi:translation elongation factor P/translation initiation factor 5A